MNDPILRLSEEPPSVGLLPGTIVDGKYRIDGCLGAGGMGVVLSATHLELDAPVAIKVVRDEFATNEEVVARMLFEARAAARMRGSHVVRVLDVARLESGAPYIVMEQLQGCDLGALLASNGALSVRDAVSYLLQACEGLCEAHALGIIHRDLKPENLFLANTPEGVVLKILDFGISKDVGTSFQRGQRSALTNAGLAVGSPYYMSPEQMRASPDVDVRADIWSLGAILFELLTGKCPFEGETLAVVCANVLSHSSPSLHSFSHDAPVELAAIVSRCLEKDQSLRFQSVTELSNALCDFVADQGLPTDSRRLASGINLKANAEAAQAAAQVASVDTLAPSSTSATSHSRAPDVDGTRAPDQRRRASALGWASGVAAMVALAVIGMRHFEGATPASESNTRQASERLVRGAANDSAVVPVLPEPMNVRPAVMMVAPSSSVGTPAQGSVQAPVRAAVRVMPPALSVRRSGVVPAPRLSAPPLSVKPATAPPPRANGSSSADADAWDVSRLGGRY